MNGCTQIDYLDKGNLEVFSRKGTSYQDKWRSWTNSSTLDSFNLSCFMDSANWNFLQVKCLRETGMMGTWKAREKSPIPRVKSIGKSLISDFRVRDIFILPTVISMWDSLHMDKSQALGSFTKMGIWLLKDFGWMEKFLAKITINTKRKSKCWPKKIGWKEAWKNPESRVLSGNRSKKYQKSTNPSTKKRQIKIWSAKSKF